MDTSRRHHSSGRLPVSVTKGDLADPSCIGPLLPQKADIPCAGRDAGATAGDTHTRMPMIGPAKRPPARPFAPSVSCARHAGRRSIRSRGERADVRSPHAIAGIGQRRSRGVPWRDIATGSGGLTGVCGCRDERSRHEGNFGHCFLHMVTEAKQARLLGPSAVNPLEYFITALSTDRERYRESMRRHTAPICSAMAWSDRSGFAATRWLESSHYSVFGKYQDPTASLVIRSAHAQR